MDTTQDPRVLFSALRVQNLSSVEELQLKRLDPKAIVTFQRKQPPCVEATVLHLEEELPFGELPQRRASLLPSPSDATIVLEILIGAELGSGRHGSVHEVEIVNAELYKTFTLPDLVVKVGLSEDSISSSSREAFYYEEMECLQGVCLARYYGLFQGVLPDGRTIPILLLERLGDLLSRPQLVDRIHEVEEIYGEFWPLGIEHNDIKRLNLLMAPAGQHALPSLTSPLSGRKYSLRIIDFAMTSKSNRIFKDLQDSDLSFIDRLETAAREYDYDIEIS